MLKLSVSNLRWLLVAANVTIAGTVTYAAVDFFYGERDEIKSRLPEPAAFKIELEEKSGGTRQQLSQLIKDVEWRPPAPRVVKTPDKRDALPPREGGPLKDWEVESVIRERSGMMYAVIKEKVEQRTAATTGRRSTTPRGGTRNRRNSRSRRPPPKPKFESRFLYIGKEFKVKSQPYVVERISISPDQVVYRSGRDRYTLVGPESVSRLKRDGVLFTLVGLDPEEVEQLSSKTGPKPPEIDPDRVGTIQKPGEKKNQKKASASPTARPGGGADAAARNKAGIERAAKLLEDSGKAGDAKKLREALKEKAGGSRDQ